MLRATSHFTRAAPSGRVADPLGKWRQWIEARFSGHGPAVAAATTAIEEVLLRKGGGVAAAVAAADEAARRVTARAESRPAPSAFDAPVLTLRSHTGNAGPPGGAYALAAADPSPRGRLAVQALDAFQWSATLNKKAFMGQPGFRGRYGFDDAAGMTRTGSNFLWLLAAVAFPIYVVAFFWMELVTPILARRASIEIKQGRLVLRYGGWGPFKKIVRSFELAWICQVYCEQTPMQRYYKQVSVFLVMDRGPDAPLMQPASLSKRTLCIPGVVAPEHAEAFCDRIRHVSQLIRMSGYA